MQSNNQQGQKCQNLNQKHQYEETTCQQCEFMQSCKLSQEIVELRQKLALYQCKNKQINQLLTSEENKKHQILGPLYKVLDNQLTSDSENQKQLQQLQQKLKEIDRQLQQEILQKSKYAQKTQELKNQLSSILSQQYQNQIQYNSLLKYHSHQLLHKETELKSLKSLLQKTNFINIIYSISFQDGDSYINGDKIIPQNSWKIIEILAFYQTKYVQYHPTVQILWDTMQLIPFCSLVQEINSGSQKSINKIQKPNWKHSLPIDICCDDQQNILQTWIPYVVLEMKNFFNFLVLQSEFSSKLKFEVTCQGQFQHMKNRTFKQQNNQFNHVIKCLLIDLDQINKLEFFAKQKRIQNDQFKNDQKTME